MTNLSLPCRIPPGSRQLPSVLGLLMIASILTACGGDEETIPVVTPTTPLPTVTITNFSPTTSTVGQILNFTFSAQLSTPAGITATDPVLVTVTPPLGERIPITTLDATQIPNCSVGSTSCTLSNVVVDASSQVALNVTGSYVITVSVLDLQGRVGQDTQGIQVSL